MTHGQTRYQSWESLPVRTDRTPNELNHIPQLYVARSNIDHPMNTSRPTFFRTEDGNINGDGEPTSFSSPVLGTRNPNLASALERNIAPLVRMVNQFDFVTYSSCEGHLIDQNFYEGYVGFLFEEDREEEMLRFISISCDVGFSPFRTLLIDSEDKISHKTVEIYFCHETGVDLRTYHRQLLRTTDRLLERIEIERRH